MRQRASEGMSSMKSAVLSWPRDREPLKFSADSTAIITTTNCSTEVHMITIHLRRAAVAAMFLTSAVAWSHELSVEECLEGGDFIMHAAMSRDYGTPRDQFISKVQGDLLLIQSFPPELRWFVQDTDDEVLLVSAAERVFDQPVDPEVHRDAFLQSCFGRVKFTPRASR